MFYVFRCAWDFLFFFFSCWGGRGDVGCSLTWRRMNFVYLAGMFVAIFCVCRGWEKTLSVHSWGTGGDAVCLSRGVGEHVECLALVWEVLFCVDGDALFILMKLRI